MKSLCLVMLVSDGTIAMTSRKKKTVFIARVL